MVLVNGTQSDLIRAMDRGLMYGDGVFRTLRIRGGAPLHWRRHYQKLQSDCAALSIACPDEALLAEEVRKSCETASDCVIKIIVTRGIGARGYAVGPAMEPTRIVMCSPLPAYPERFFQRGIKVHLCDTRLSFQPRLAGVKHLNRLENVLARMEWSDEEIAEGILLDPENNAVEGTATNLFMVKGEVLYTPDLGRCGVAGVQRGRIMDFAAELGMPLKIQHLPLQQLMEADEIMLCNSVIGLWRVNEFNGKTWESGKMTAIFRQLDDSRND